MDRGKEDVTSTNELTEKNVFLEKKDTTPVNDSKTIERIINGKKFVFELNGKFKKSISFAGYEKQLEVKEVYPNVVLYDKYFSDKILPYRSNDSLIITKTVKDKFEFYGKDSLVKIFVIDDHNPYLKSKDVKIKQHFSDTEGTYIVPKEATKYKVSTEYHLRQSVEQRGRFSKIVYWKNEVTEKGGVIGNISTMLVLDSNGDEIFNLEFDGFCSLPIVDVKGRYLLFAFELPKFSVKSNFGNGFEIWDMESKKIVHKELIYNTDLAFGGIANNGNCLRVEYSFPNDPDYDSYHYLFDSEQFTLYSKRFTTHEWKEVRKLWKTINGDFLELRNHFTFERKDLEND